MKKTAKPISVGFGIGVLLLSVLAAKPLFFSEFEITIETTATGLTATCEHGCAWQTLSYSCGDEAESCQAVIDEKGVRSVEGSD